MDELLLMSTENTPLGSPQQCRPESTENKFKKLREEEEHIKQIIKEHQQKQNKIYALRKEVKRSSLTKFHFF